MEEGVWGLPARPPAPLSAPVPVEPDLSVPAYAPVLPPMPAPDSDFTIEPFEAAPLPPVAETEEFAFPALPAEILPATVAPAPETYRVKKGDTLSGIARKLYGDPHAWRPIFEANRDILSSPDKLRPDMTLTIPPAP